jgi:hypothetical protein
MHTVDYILHIILKEKNYVCGGHDGTFLLWENEIVPRNTKRKKRWTKDIKNAVTRMNSLYKKKKGGDVTFVPYSHNFHRSLNTSIERVIRIVHLFHCPIIQFLYSKKFIQNLMNDERAFIMI